MPAGATRHALFARGGSEERAIRESPLQNFIQCRGYGLRTWSLHKLHALYACPCYGQGGEVLQAKLAPPLPNFINVGVMG